ncbi:MAG: sigma-70 family RNA polymerase sigma factor [Eubacteriales bacterium]
MPPHTQEEKRLVHKAKNGSQIAFGELVSLHEKKIFALCYRMMGNPDDAQDAAQEAFFSAWRALPNFKEESAFGTWLYRLANNACIDLLRKQNRYKTTSLSQEFEEGEEGAELQIPDNTTRPDTKFEQKELGIALQEGLDSLPSNHREVLLLREISGLSYQEISEKLDLDLGTVKSRIARGRTTLRKFLLEKGNFSP